MDEAIVRRELKAAVTMYRNAQASAELWRVTLRDHIVDALKAGTSQAELVKTTGYSREQLRRIARDAGIKP